MKPTSVRSGLPSSELLLPVPAATLRAASWALAIAESKPPGSGRLSKPVTRELIWLSHLPLTLLNSSRAAWASSSSLSLETPPA